MSANSLPQARSFYDEVYQATGYAADAEDVETYRGRIEEMSHYTGFDGLTLEIGCGAGLMSRMSPGYVGIDISWTALRGKEYMGAVSSADTLPFPGNTFDNIFSYHMLEHIERPELVLEEIARVSKPGGVIYLKPAWNCRSWNNKKLIRKPYSILPFREKIEKALIPIRGSVALRGLIALPKRLAADVFYAVSGKHTRLKYGRLTPNYEYDRYWISDADAVVSIDPHELIWFFKSRGYKIISHSTLLKRLFARSEGVAITR
ncbi:MAG TPA: class I SAM-dependent methyltransferase [Blastocatellia bacterium]|jgi:SAM-dependent methyltransferase|nr:class I SAM-dependent methyltransferase [Blastocatellia bacterium]